MGRSPCCDKSKVKRGSWSPEEDATLKNYLYEHGTGGNWIALPQKAGLKRCGKSCRLRWLNYLRPDIKHGAFTQEEENIIFNLYNTIGSRWSVIASHLPGRTDNDVKNYWNTKLKKKIMAEYGNSPTTSNMTTTTTVAASNVAEAVPGTTTTATVVDMTPTFQSSTNSLDLVPTFSMPFLQDNTTTLNANATSIISYDPINCPPPRFILEGSNNYSNENNIDPFSPINQDSSNFKPSSLEMDENYGFKGIPMDEYSYEVLSGVWSQSEYVEDDSNTDLFSNFLVDSKPQGVSQSHSSILE